MRLTTARYFTPSGVSIQAKGIEPDIIVDSGVKNLKDKKIKNRREEDLRGALDNKKKSEEKEIEKKNPLTPLKKLLQDNQISRAVDLIRGINLFNNKLKFNSTASINKNNLSRKIDSAKN